MSPDSLLYIATDILAMDLHLMAEEDRDMVRGFESRVLKVGPWEIPTDISVCSDVLDPKLASFIVRITPSLWLYLVTPDDAAATLYVFDGKALNLKAKDMKAFGTGKVDETLKKIGKVVTAMFAYEADAWAYQPVELLKAKKLTA
jgi:hypothetical protein